jgi:hypothetical protein
MTRHRAPVLLAALLAFHLPASAQPSLSQTLPRGFDAGTGGSGSAFPFNNTNDHIWQWHYDSGQFNAMGPIRILEISVRPLSPAQAAAFSFPSVEVVVASSPTDYSVAGNGTQPGHASAFAANLNPDQLVVRPASPWSIATPTSNWIPFGLTNSFLYDPTQGLDFVVQIRKCGTNVTWGASIFGATGSAGQVGGNRYGDQTNCMATNFSFNNNEYVPIVKIDYIENNRLFISQSGPGVADLFVSLTDIVATANEGWILPSALQVSGVGAGPLLGIWPDASTWQILFGAPLVDGNPFHFPIPSATGAFPNVPIQAPPGTVPFLAGLNLDFVALLVTNPGFTFAGSSNVVRILFQ